MKSTSAKLLIPSIAFLAAAPFAHAQALLDFQFSGPGATGYSGAAFIGSTGDDWNQVALVAGSTFNQTSGFSYADGSAASGITLTNLSNMDIVDSQSNTTDNALLNSYIGASPAVAASTPLTLTIAGLTAGASYNLFVYASSDHQGVGGIFSFNGSQTQTLNGASGTNFSLDIDTLEFNVVADSNGDINLSETAVPATEYRVLNGLQLQSASVPEPSTYALLGGGFAALIAFGIRRKNSLS